MQNEGVIAVYIMTNRRNGALYTGVSSDLARRVHEHRLGAFRGFTQRYGCNRLVWWEPHDLVTAAMQRERAIKHWPRRWKINLIEAINPDWRDLYADLNR